MIFYLNSKVALKIYYLPQIESRSIHLYKCYHQRKANALLLLLQEVDV